MRTSLNYGWALGLVAVASTVVASGARATDIPESARRIAATLQLASQEYRLAFRGTALVHAAERDEAALFIAEARRTAAQLPAEAARILGQRLEEIAALIDRAAPPESVAARAADAERWLAAVVGGPLDERPVRTPSLAHGARLFAGRCAQCHGDRGFGDGPAAAGLVPPPSRLADPTVLAAVTPLDVYRRVSLGVPGTAMPALDPVLPHEDRWDVTAYVVALGDSTAARVPDAARALSLATVRATLRRALATAERGDSAGAAAQALDAYLAFEGLEASLRVSEPRLVVEAERAFAEFRLAAASGAGMTDLARRHAGLDRLLVRTANVLAARPSSAGLFAESVLLLVREGFEAILVIGAIIAVLVKSGAAARRREVWLGVSLAVAASLLTAGVLARLVQVAPARREALEGAVMLAAAGVLFYVSFWLVSKLDAAAWRRFVRERVRGAVEGGGTLALAAAAFLAVYREGFETVLFYQALFGTAGPAGAAPVTAGLLTGAAALVLLYVAIERFGLRVPLRPFFGVTGGLLYLMAFVFAGRGVIELQEGRVLPATPLGGWPRVELLGLYPTAESLAAQGALLLALAAALLWMWRREARGSPAPAGPPEDGLEEPAAGRARSHPAR